jgi:hypothetical protein
VKRLRRERLGQLFVFGFDPQGEDVAVHTGQPSFSKSALVHCVVEAFTRIPGAAPESLIRARLQVRVRRQPLAASGQACDQGRECQTPP